MKRKILFLGRFPPPVHGASKMNELYFKSKIINKNFEVKKIKINYYKSLDELGKFNLKKFSGIFDVFFKLISELFSFKPDLVYFEIATQGPAFIRDSLYVWICRLLKKKIVFHIHSKKINKSLYAKSVFRGYKTIILSELLYKNIKEVFRKKDLYILPNGIEEEISDREFYGIMKQRKKNKKLVLLFLSNMIGEKGIFDVLKICKRLKQKKKSFECLFVGSWPDTKTKEMWMSLRKAYGLEKECKFLGPRYSSDKKKVLKKTDFLVFPTSYEVECFPLVILEAFMFGIPVFSYDNGAIKEMVSKKHLGYVVKMGEWEQLAEKIENTFKRNVNYERIRNTFNKKHTLETAEKILLRIFKKELK